jgi:hypothetical protein
MCYLPFMMIFLAIIFICFNLPILKQEQIVLQCPAVFGDSYLLLIFEIAFVITCQVAEL